MRPPTPNWSSSAVGTSSTAPSMMIASNGALSGTPRAKDCSTTVIDERSASAARAAAANVASASTAMTSLTSIASTAAP